MKLEDWDIQVRPHLVGIEAASQVVMRHALALPCKAQFLTIAEDEMATARKVLGDALENIVKAQAIYQGKPLECA